jgi:hypothetical protein
MKEPKTAIVRVRLTRRGEGAKEGIEDRQDFDVKVVVADMIVNVRLFWVAVSTIHTISRCQPNCRLGLSNQVDTSRMIPVIK